MVGSREHMGNDRGQRMEELPYNMSESGPTETKTSC